MWPTLRKSECIEITTNTTLFIAHQSTKLNFCLTINQYTIQINDIKSKSMLAENIEHNTQMADTCSCADVVEVLTWHKVCVSSINIPIVLYLSVSNQ